MSTPTGLIGLLLAALLMPFHAFSAQAVTDLDVTIRMIERQDRDIDTIINRIAPPEHRHAIRPERGQGGESRHDDDRGGSANRAGSDRSRDRDRSSGGPDDRRQQTAETVEMTRDARERRREAQEDARRDARDESRDGQRRFRDR